LKEMDIVKWFKKFLKSYRSIVDSNFPEDKSMFPLYPPIDVSVYLIDDVKGILPQVVVFFESGFEEWPASDAVMTNDVKINWEKNPDELEEMNRNIEIQTKWHETFYDEIQHPGVVMQEAFKREIFLSKPSDIAMIYIQKHLIHEKQKEQFENFLKLSELRKSIIGVEKFKEFESKLAMIQNMKDQEKADILSRVFWLMGFEVINLERLREIPQYKGLNERPHVDLIAVLLSEKLLVAVDEGEMNKERWYKLYSLDYTLKTLGFLGEKKDWQVSFVAIGRKSKGVEYLEGSVQVISLDNFQQIVHDYFASKGWAPLDAIRRIVGYKMTFFKVKI